MTPFPRTCACGRVYDRAAWEALTTGGTCTVLHAVSLQRLTWKGCLCGTTVTVSEEVSPRDLPAVGQCGTCGTRYTSLGWPRLPYLGPQRGLPGDPVHELRT